MTVCGSELQLALAEVLLKLNETAAAANQLPQLQELDQAADYLKNRYWELGELLFAAQAQWQQAYQAGQQASDLPLSQLSMQQKNTLDLLQQNFKTTATATTTTGVTTAEPTMVDAIVCCWVYY